MNTRRSHASARLVVSTSQRQPVEGNLQGLPVTGCGISFGVGIQSASEIGRKVKAAIIRPIIMFVLYGVVL